MKVQTRIIDFMSLNEEQQGVLDLDSQVFVEAGAGSGKTRALVARYLYILEQGRADVDGIVAITFTENAAAEMRERIRKDINEYIAKYGEINFLNKGAPKKLPNAPISTIHGFSARIIQENPLESILSPGFSILEGAEEGLFTDEKLNEFLQGLWESEGRAERELLTGVLAEEGYDLDKLKQSILSVIYYAKTLHLEPPWNIYSDGNNPESDVDGLLSLLLDEINSSFKSPSRFVQTRVDGMKRIGSRLHHSGRVSARARPIFGIKDKLQEILRLTRVKEEEISVAQDLLGIADSVLNIYDTRLTQAYLKLSERAYRFLQEKKRESGFLDYEDLLLYTREMLRGNLHLANYYRRKLKFIMVDEFQDTDGLQFEIIDLLCASGGANLFIVGDPKQSIFRFRGGDYNVFLNFNKKANNPKKFAINYRSRKPLINYYNSFFKTLLDPLYEDMVSADEDDPENPCVEYVITPLGNASEWRKGEASKIARRVIELQSHGYSFKDIAILLRASTYIKTYENALRELNIPFFSVGGRGFFERQEIRDLVVFLRYLVYPKDIIAEACVLRSPFLGASDDDLLAHYSKKEEVALINEFLNFIGGLRKEVLSLTPLSIIERVAEETGYIASIVGLPDGRGNYANFIKLINIVARLESLGLGISELVDYLEAEFIEDAESVSQAELEGENSVKILTVHKAKGLEFPVVFLADLNHQPGGGGERVLARRGEGFLVRCDGSKSSLWEKISELENRDGLEEEKRILYVAKTRAKERLILCVGGKKNKNGRMSLRSDTFAGLLDSVVDFLPGCEDRDSISPFGVDIPVWKGVTGEETEVALDDKKQVEPLDMEILERRFTDIIKPEDFEKREESQFSLLGGRLSHPDIDTLMHRFLGVWDFQEQSVANTVRFVLNEIFISDSSLEEGLTLLANNFLSSDLMPRIRNTKRIYREFPFCVEIDGVVERGVMDLVLEGDDVLGLFDYKFVSDEDELLSLKHRLERYSRALEKKFGFAVGEKFFVLLPGVRLMSV
ncbi:MAG TPA: UvrD-helicase domain-containing protein [Thermodesulfobacteriota bacterium]|nr:UvrD-helicase domain-containing protein [Thermodesulfobacteriota bacterium]